MGALSVVLKEIGTSSTPAYGAGAAEAGGGSNFESGTTPALVSSPDAIKHTPKMKNQTLIMNA